jgi:hypothetical protein
VGEVRATTTDPGGDVGTLHVRTGGFLGFGTRIVAIPAGSFTRSGQIIRLNLSAEQVNKLPSMQDAK